jgi:aminoglycoside phosphotransferase (APT) family kinase protein
MNTDIEPALAAFAPPGTRIANLRRLTGGASLETWSYDEIGQDGASRPLILRRRSSGEHGTIDTANPLSTEAALLRAVGSQGVPVADPVYEAAPGHALGEAYVMRRIDGETLGRRIATDPRFDAVRPALASQCGAAIARIQSVDTATLPPLATLSGADLIDQYEQSYRTLSGPRPAIEAAIRWLRATVPPPRPPVLVHGDFRNGNIIVDEQQGLAAVLDWELTHLGDPAEDIGWICVNSWRFGQTDKRVGGFGTLDALLDGYRAAGGMDLTREDIRWWEAMGTFKWAVVTMGMYNSYATGKRPTIERALIGRRTSECEADLVALMQASTEERG